ncbi:HlyD family efflux transporter periplasmic adaptor subunit [Bowmanella denitrificans]|uniref:HlyD family efflux transporter periplasmic adaptor subunit n=1 Tax=Bowmanella denitrificans TaxID=366582 RepID=A0ABN0XA28_9ALTE
MQINLEKKSSKRGWYMAAGVGALLALSIYSLNSENIPSVSASEVQLLAVEQGNMNLYSQAFGEFFSAEERLLTAQSMGKVAMIYQRPGASVKADTPILLLANPELQQEVSHEQGELLRQQAALASFELEQNNDRLDFEGQVADIASALEQAEMELAVLIELKDRGVSASLDIKRAELDVKLQKRRLEFEKQKLVQFMEMQALQLQQQKIEVQQQEQRVALLQTQLQDLQITAGIEGTLQSLDVELGQNVPQGASLGKVGSDSKLLARLRVPQHQADQIQLGADVLVQTRKGEVKGKVNRVESVVTNGTVLAEVGLEGELPADARPAMSVTGQIFLQSLQQALYVAQAPGLRPRSQLQRFVMTGEGLAEQRTIELGDISQGHLQVLSGLQANEQVIAQMPEQWASHQKIQIEQKG